MIKIIKNIKNGFWQKPNLFLYILIMCVKARFFACNNYKPIIYTFRRINFIKLFNTFLDKFNFVSLT